MERTFLALPYFHDLSDYHLYSYLQGHFKCGVQLISQENQKELRLTSYRTFRNHLLRDLVTMNFSLLSEFIKKDLHSAKHVAYRE